jgi:hypothetical protein
MNVFISWSGERSKAVAELLKGWIKATLQATEPWMSGRDLDRGAVWFSEITDQLKDSSVGIVCLTHENKNKPWILFEAGALAKGLSSNRVCTLLIDLEHTDIEDPLAQFNHTKLSKAGMLQLLTTLNKSLGTLALQKEVLDEVFETYWPNLESKISAALKATASPSKAKPRTNEEILAEILENTRQIKSQGARNKQLFARRESPSMTALRETVRNEAMRDLSQEEIAAFMRGSSADVRVRPATTFLQGKNQHLKGLDGTPPVSSAPDLEQEP